MPSPLLMSWSRLSLALMILVACNEPTRGCDVCTFSAVVYGTVTYSTGTPATGAIVRAYSAIQNCRVDTAPAATEVVDGAGRYRIQVQAGSSTPECVQIEVSSPSGAFPSLRMTVPPVSFKRSAQASLPYDSVRVDLRLE